MNQFTAKQLQACEDIFEAIRKFKSMDMEPLVGVGDGSSKCEVAAPWYAPLQQMRCTTPEAETLRERLVLLGVLGLTKMAAMESAIPHLMSEEGGLRSFRSSDLMRGQV